MGAMDRIYLERYLSFWESVKTTVILTCEEKIVFYCYPESWPVFRLEPTVILIQCGLLELFSPYSSVVGGTFTVFMPPHQFFQLFWIWKVLKIVLNNILLSWTLLR